MLNASATIVGVVTKAPELSRENDAPVYKTWVKTIVNERSGDGFIAHDVTIRVVVPLSLQTGIEKMVNQKVLLDGKITFWKPKKDSTILMTLFPTLVQLASDTEETTIKNCQLYSSIVFRTKKEATSRPTKNSTMFSFDAYSPCDAEGVPFEEQGAIFINFNKFADEPNAPIDPVLNQVKTLDVEGTLAITWFRNDISLRCKYSSATAHVKKN